MHRRGDRTNSGQLNCWCPTRLLQFSTAGHHYLEHQQNPACHQHAGSSGHRHWKTRSHNTGLGGITLDPSPVAHHLQSRSHDLQNTSFKKTDYLLELQLSFQAGPRKLRSSSSYRLHDDVPMTVFAGRAFCFAGLQIWNSLLNFLTDFSLPLDNFKHQLRTYLFNQAYRH